jgi:2-polyprenyl-6-methoxyphenol hydroxylase-like FAD-dependent oxidoreductase
MTITGPNRGDGHAVVLGASWAGLLAARVLSNHFERVTLVERDELSNGPTTRRGVPQGRHAHALLARGRQIIEELFPDITIALVKAGASLVDAAEDGVWYHFGGFKRRFRSGIVGPSMSRPLLESLIRARVVQLPNVRLLPGWMGCGLASDGDPARVTGVHLCRSDHRTTIATESADLVVDATGRGSQAPAWLEGLGYRRPAEGNVVVNVGYSSRIYRRRPGDLPEGKLLVILPTPPEGKRMGAMFPIEGDRWLVSLGGWLGDHPPADEAGFLEFARSLETPVLYRALGRLEPVSDFSIHRLPTQRRRRFERMSRLPGGFVATGDAICSFNPLYGQGMTVSAIEATELDRSVREGRPEDLPKRFYRRAARSVDVAWQLATSEDARYPEIAGHGRLRTRLRNGYTARLHRAVTRDREVSAAFLRVMNMLEPPVALLRPRVALRVLRLGGRERGRDRSGSWVGGRRSGSWRPEPSLGG